MDCKEIINIFGLTINFIGTFFIVFFTSKDDKEWIEGEDGQKYGEKWYSIITKHPSWLKLGTILIAIGFFLSLLSSLLK
jgi:hypothetical protein